MRARLAVSLAAWQAAVACAAAAAEPAVDKRQLHLLNPTPRALMRPLSTDRPDITESAYSVDAGHFQVEMDVVRFTYDRHNAEHSRTRVRTWTVADSNFKVGLLNDVDLQLVVPVYTDAATTGGGVTTHQRGFGDLEVRVKWNLWGNDGGQTALAVMPFVKLPTNQDDLGNDAVEGGLIFPLAVQDLPWGFEGASMLELDAVQDEDGDGFHAEVVNTVIASHDIVGALGGFVELASTATTDADGHWIALLNLGLTYAIGDDLRLDCGVTPGLTRAADDISTFFGLSWRR